MNEKIILLSFLTTEFLFRIIPTRNNFSGIDCIKDIMTAAHNIIDKYIPNRRK